MSTPKNTDLEKHTMNFRTGDFDKIAQLFPRNRPSITIRNLVSKIVDEYYVESKVPELDDEYINL